MNDRYYDTIAQSATCVVEVTATETIAGGGNFIFRTDPAQHRVDRYIGGQYVDTINTDRWVHVMPDRSVRIAGPYTGFAPRPQDYAIVGYVRNDQ